MSSRAGPICWGVGQFVKAEPVGEQGRKGLAGTVYDKVVAKLDFLQGCAGLYAASIGASSIRRLMAAGIQPIIVDNGHEILDLLNEVSLALAQPGLLSWVDRARERSTINPPSPFAAGAFRDTRSLITSIDDC